MANRIKWNVEKEQRGGNTFMLRFGNLTKQQAAAILQAAAAVDAKGDDQ